MTDTDPAAKSAGIIVGAVVGIIFLLLAGLFVTKATSLANLRSSSSTYLVAQLQSSTPRAEKNLQVPSAPVLAAALKDEPLNPAIVNAAIFAEAARNPNRVVAPEKMELLARLGWRNSAALQNRIVFAGQRQDIDQIIQVADALLRREELEDQGYALMQLIEREPSTRPKLISALARQPVWRSAYFQQPVKPVSKAALDGRLEVALTLGMTGVSLTRQELYYTLWLLTDNAYSQDAYKLWLANTGQQPGLLNDTGFRQAYDVRDDGFDNMPFEWHILSGAGFWTELVGEDDKIHANINWNGRGAPVFLQQRLFLGARQTGFVLEVAGIDLPDNLTKLMSFSLDCPGQRLVFDRIVRAGSGRYILATAQDMRCEDPFFRIAGKPGAFGTSTGSDIGFSASGSLNLMITGLTLKRQEANAPARALSAES